MGEIRIVSPGKTHGYPFPVSKKRLVGTGEADGYPYLVRENKSPVPNKKNAKKMQKISQRKEIGF